MDVDEEVLPPIEESEEHQQQQKESEQKKVYIPGRHILEKDEILEPDDSVYIMRHTMNLNWPCLSFDVLRDNLGDERQRYPATAYIVAGSQASIAKDNELSVCKMTSLHKTQKDGSKSFQTLTYSHTLLINMGHMNTLFSLYLIRNFNTHYMHTQTTPIPNQMKTKMSKISTKMLSSNTDPYPTLAESTVSVPNPSHLSPLSPPSPLHTT